MSAEALHKSTGSLFLIPSPLSEEKPGLQASQGVQEIVHNLGYFIVERARTTRRWFSTLTPKPNIEAMTFYELDKYEPAKDIDYFLQAALDGHDIGLISEAGNPASADPGNLVVRRAHELGICVRPLPGPSSILLALISSGMNGQEFSFHGYLPAKSGSARQRLIELEKKATDGYTHIFMEAPYRNNALLKLAIDHLSSETQFGIASQLTTSAELILSKPISEWRKTELPDLHKKPTIFLLCKSKTYS